MKATCRGEAVELLVMGVLRTEHASDEWDAFLMLTCQKQKIYLLDEEKVYHKVADGVKQLYGKGVVYPQELTLDEMVRKKSLK